MSQRIERLRAAFVRPSPRRLVVAAIGLLVLVIPATRPLGDVRVMACAGCLAVVATIVLSFPGLPTAACGIGIVETTMVAVHGDAFTIAVLQAVALLAYLVVIDLAVPGGVEIKSDVARQASEETSVFLGGLALIAVVGALALVGIAGSFWVALLGVVAAVAAVAVLRRLHSD